MNGRGEESRGSHRCVALMQVVRWSRLRGNRETYNLSNGCQPRVALNVSFAREPVLVGLPKLRI
jgi:hypothetical protein